MTTDLERDNIVNALKGDPIIRSCVSCKHYRYKFFSDVICVRLRELEYHPITGKKVWMGDTYACKDDRCFSARISDRPDGPWCGPEGRFWEKKSNK